MCVVSAIHQYGSSIPLNGWKYPNAVFAWEELIEKARKFDEITKQPDCVDPEKEKLVRDILEYLNNKEK